MYQGGNRELSKFVSEDAYIRGSRVLSIISKALKPLGCLPDSLFGCLSIQKRITEMLNLADTFIFILGDLATLEVLITFASWAHLTFIKEPIGLLNVNNFYDSLIVFLNHVIKNHFILFTVKKLLLLMSYLIFYKIIDQS